MSKSITSIMDELKKYEALAEAFAKDEINVELVKKQVVNDREYSFCYQGSMIRECYPLTDKAIHTYLQSYCVAQTRALKRELKEALKDA